MNTLTIRLLALLRMPATPAGGVTFLQRTPPFARTTEVATQPAPRADLADRYIVIRATRSAQRPQYDLIDARTQRTIRRYRSPALAVSDADFLNSRLPS
jgi:hypothetical protein